MTDDHLPMHPLITFRIARREDVPRLVEMLANDPLGAKRERFEDPLPNAYFAAFEAIDKDPNHELIVAETDGEIAGFLQISFLPYLTYQGGWRALIEGVRVSKNLRGAGVGRALVEHAVKRAIERQCHLVQLTTDKQRPDALAFYKKLGFEATHEGMKKRVWGPGSGVIGHKVGGMR